MNNRRHHVVTIIFTDAANRRTLQRGPALPATAVALAASDCVLTTVALPLEQSRWNHRTRSSKTFGLALETDIHPVDSFRSLRDRLKQTYPWVEKARLDLPPRSSDRIRNQRCRSRHPRQHRLN